MSENLSRRSLLAAGVVMTAGASAAAGAAGEPAWAGDSIGSTGSTGSSGAPSRAAAAAAADFAAMRKQWSSLHVGEGYDPTDPDIAGVLTGITQAANDAWSSMNKAADRAYLWEDAKLEVDQSFAISRSFDRLYRMALGWASTGSGVAGHADLLADITAGMDWMVAHYYTETGKIIGNWYEWQISGPMSFEDGIVLVYDQLTADQVGAYTRAIGNFTPQPSGTAANLALTASVVVGRGALAGDEAAVASGVQGIGPVLAYVEKSDGFYRDGSFIQHDYYPYIGAYGASILQALVPIFTTVAGTPWQVDAPIVYDWLENAIDPVMYHGALMDMVSGRTIARWDEHEHYHGHYVIPPALQLLRSAPADRKAALSSMVKEWLVGDTYDDPTPRGTIPDLLAATTLVADTKTPRRGMLLGSRVYAHEDRIVHRRPDWALGISMHSARIATYESINAENLRGWTTADGAVYLHIGRSDQYVEGFWPTVDPARIPGTTVDVRSRADHEGAGYRGPQTWAGGATLAARWTAGGLDHGAFGTTLTARKSWLCFDDEVVFLGAGISAHDGRSVETVVENRKLRSGSERLLVDGGEPVRAVGSSATPQHVRWMALEGTAGWVFLDRPTLHVTRSSRTGAWSDITHHPNWADSTPITHPYLTAWLDHGVDPASRSYAYVLLPGATPTATARYSAHPGIEVVANTTSVQAAQSTDTGVLAANFWAAGTAGPVRVSAPCSLVVRSRAGKVSLAVADPSHGATEPFTVSLPARASKVVSASDGITVQNLAPLTVRVDPSGTAGATLTLETA